MIINDNQQSTALKFDLFNKKLYFIIILESGSNLPALRGVDCKLLCNCFSDFDR